MEEITEANPEQIDSEEMNEEGGLEAADEDDPLSEEEIEEEAELEPPPVLSAMITSPHASTVFEEGTEIPFTGLVHDSVYPADQLFAEWTSSLDGSFSQGAPLADGSVRAATSELSPGYHDIMLLVRAPDAREAFDMARIGVCSWGTPETFDADLEGSDWNRYGHATWDPGGWLEMTGDIRDRQGAIFNIVPLVSAGDVSIRFKIMTGPNVDTGADGFAMSIFDASSVAQLESIIAAAGNGGGLGYGVSGGYGSFEVSGFHIEFDTWPNHYNGNTELHTDPTEENHVAVTLDGDPGNHVLWEEIPNIEDMQWHEVTVEINGIHVRVTLDGTEVIDGDVQGLDFKGGYLGFSGTTGYYHNYHRFDDLQILQECMVPSPTR